MLGAFNTRGGRKGGALISTGKKGAPRHFTYAFAPGAASRTPPAVFAPTFTQPPHKWPNSIFARR